MSTIALHFDVEGRFGPLRAFDKSVSWRDPERFAVLRSQKREHQPFSSHDERVEVFPDERRWTASSGASGATSSDAPLDELSFIYLLRSVSLETDSVYRFDRHFDAGRNPTTVTVLGRETVIAPAGEFRTIVLEMRVKDPRRYKGDGRLRINLSDDACRVPVRMESTMPLAGTTVLMLESRSDSLASCS